MQNNNSSYYSGATRPNTTTAYNVNPNNQSLSVYDRILNEPLDSLMNL